MPGASAERAGGSGGSARRHGADARCPVENIASDDGAHDDKDNPHGDPPAVGNPHGEPPGHTDDEVEEAPVTEVLDEVVEELPPIDEPSDATAEDAEQELPPVPDADVVTPTPSIVAPDENIFVPAEPEPDPAVSPPEEAAASTPPESSDAPLPSLPPTRPPEDVPGPVTTETPTTE